MVRNYKIPAVVLFALSLFGKDLFGQSQAKQKLQDAAGVLQRSLKSIPEQMLNKSVCVLVVPRESLAEIGASGFISCRIGDTKSWSSPGSVRFWGPSLGSLIKEHAFVFLAMNRKSANSIISEKMLLGPHSSVLQGPISGKKPLPAENIGSADILAYPTPIISLSSASLRDVSVRDDLDANKEIYGWALENTSIISGSGQVPQVVAPFMKALDPCRTSTSSTSRAARIRQAACENGGAQIDFPK